MSGGPSRLRLDRSARQLVVDWPDGVRVSYPWTLLRANCPSAGERIARENANPLAVLGHVPSSEIVEARMVGNYAITFIWGDGHSAGIYTWSYLRALADRPGAETSAPA